MVSVTTTRLKTKRRIISFNARWVKRSLVTLSQVTLAPKCSGLLSTWDGEALRWGQDAWPGASCLRHWQTIYNWIWIRGPLRVLWFWIDFEEVEPTRAGQLALAAFSHNPHLNSHHFQDFRSAKRKNLSQWNRDGRYYSVELELASSVIILILHSYLILSLLESGLVAS